MRQERYHRLVVAAIAPNKLHRARQFTVPLPGGCSQRELPSVERAKGLRFVGQRRVRALRVTHELDSELRQGDAPLALHFVERGLGHQFEITSARVDVSDSYDEELQLYAFDFT